MALSGISGNGRAGEKTLGCREPVKDPPIFLSVEQHQEILHDPLKFAARFHLFKLRYLRFLAGVGVRLAMQLAMNASPAPRADSNSDVVC